MFSTVKTSFRLLWLTSLFITGALLSASAQQADRHSELPGYPDRYMGGEADLATASNGAVVYADLSI